MPTAIAKPICLAFMSLFSISELNDAESTRPAAVIAGATARTARCGGFASGDAVFALFAKPRGHQDVVVGADRDDEEEEHERQREDDAVVVHAVLEDEDGCTERRRELEADGEQQVHRCDHAAQHQDQDQEDQGGCDRENESRVTC